MTSVPEFGEPTETVLPRMSSIVSMPESALTTTCVMFGYSVASARSGSGRSKDALPRTASIALSASENASSESSPATSRRLSTDAEVVSAVVGASGSSSVIRSASPPP